MMEKHYTSEALEQKILKLWEETGAFLKPDAQASSSSDEASFTLLMPPPNVTGSLHMGHALTFTIQDMLVRYHRLRGSCAWWQPGLDHAGIATQMMVERQLWDQEKTTRHDCGRDAFLEKVWAWKEASGGTIVEQLKRLGASTDWSQLRFTMDPQIQEAVIHAFVTLHEDGLIYRAHRLVNWDPKLQTALSDLEVISREVQGNLYYIAYPCQGEALVVATTRPETLFGDTAVAVHPEDPRYQKFIGSSVRIPLTDRLIPVIADEGVDMDQGTGALKITPAHDFHDYQVGQKHGLPTCVVMDEHARLWGDDVPQTYQGLDRFEARHKVVAELEEKGFLIRVEPITHAVPHGDRSGVVLEPRLTQQWFLDAARLAPEALQAVKQGETVFVPSHWHNLYEEWLSNIQPWCLSRQIWWGHRIPAWYGPDGHVFVARTMNDAMTQAEKHYAAPQPLTQDPDVLDTWFSSGLWPFVTQGWPHQTGNLAQHYPSDVLVTGFDIIFFWVARMMMLGLYFMKRPPFKAIYIHGLIRDAQGQKMSKTKGNVVDPLALMETYGADAVRFALLWSLAPGRDIHFSEERVVWARHFMTKIWNSARYVDLQLGEDKQASAGVPRPQHVVNQWILSRLKTLTEQMHRAMTTYHIHEYVHHIYHEIWDVFCDWYVELTKPLMAESAWQQETRQTLRYVWGKLLALAHPMIPFITQELWTALGGEGPLNIRVDEDALPLSEKACASIEWLQAVVTSVRSVRNQLRVPASRHIPVTCEITNPQEQVFWQEHASVIARMTRVQPVELAEHALHGVVKIHVPGGILHLGLGDVVDLGQEHARLIKEKKDLEREIQGLEGRLNNPSFCERAPAEVLEETRHNHQERLRQLQTLHEWLACLEPHLPSS